ncbi:hypothetical protein FHG87_010423 [Trinorchestia longiramus]|nr:hypothetical protein FHG87_010423 [Trinorchestia longiramus]
MIRKNMEENISRKPNRKYDFSEKKQEIKFDEESFKVDTEHNRRNKNDGESIEDFFTENNLSSRKTTTEQNLDHVMDDAGSHTLTNDDGVKFVNERSSSEVTDIRTQTDYEKFIENATSSDAVRVVFYYDQAASEDRVQASFLKLYDAASPLLSPYGIRVAKVECGSVQHSRQCAGSRRGSFCFGFRGGIQKIAFPLHTVATEDSLVSSVLHFAALDVVPIVQVASELRALQRRCLAVCNIFVSIIKTLGSAQHRAVLEAALSLSTSSMSPHQKSLVFAIATSARAVASLPTVTGWEGAWLLQCDALLPCTASPYRGTISKHDLLLFVNFLQLPLWAKLRKESDHYFYDTKLLKYDTDIQENNSHLGDKNWKHKSNKKSPSHEDWSSAISGQASSSPLTPHLELFKQIHDFQDDENNYFTNDAFSGTTTILTNATKLMKIFLKSGMSLVLLVTDGATEQRVDLLAPQLARLLRGAAGLIVMFMERMPASLLRRFEIASFTTPTMMFIPPFQMVPSAHVVNFENPLEWVNEQLSRLQPESPPDSTEGYSPLPHLEELQQDDEVVLSMVTEKSLRVVSRLQGEDDLRKRTRHSSFLLAVAYGYSWDASTNVLRQHLSELLMSLTSLHSKATVHSVDCYDFPSACSNFSHLPTLVFYLGDKSLLYRGPLYAAAILRSILILETAWPAVSISEKSVPAFLNLTMFPTLKEVVATAVLGVFTQEKAARAYTDATKVYRQDVLFALTNATEDNARKWCLNSFTRSPSNCLIIVKKDPFQKRIILRGTLSNSSEIIKKLDQATSYVLEKLQPHRLMNFLNSSRGNRKKSAFLVLLLVRSEEGSVVKNVEFQALSKEHKKKTKISRMPIKTINVSTPELQQCVIGDCEKENTFIPIINSAIEEKETKTPHDRCKLSDWLKFGCILEKSEALTGSQLFESVGHVAMKMTSDELMFSWIPKNSSLAKTAQSAWRCPEATCLVGLDTVSSKVFCGATFRSETSLLQWVRDLMAGKLTETEVLRPTRWRPLLHGLDYLRLLEEEAEEGPKF